MHFTAVQRIINDERVLAFGIRIENAVRIICVFNANSTSVKTWVVWYISERLLMGRKESNQTKKNLGDVHILISCTFAI